MVDPEVFADFARQMFVDFAVARNGGATILSWIVPPGVATALTQKLATVEFQMPN